MIWVKRFIHLIWFLILVGKEVWSGYTNSET